MELNPNCSELVMRLGMSKKEIKEKLKEIGIEEKKIENWYSFDKEPVEMLVDKDNPNTPDYEDNARAWLCELKDMIGGGEGWGIMAHQHCQRQIFPTLKKIEDVFGVSVEGHDGGGTTDYEEWVEDGCPKIPDYNRKARLKRHGSIEEKFVDTIIDSLKPKEEE